MLYKDKKGNKTVFGVFENRDVVESVLKDLLSAGFHKSNISTLIPSKQNQQDKGKKQIDYSKDELIAGGILGSLLSEAVLIGTSMGTLIATGPILAVIGTVGALGAIGGFIGVLVTRTLVEYGLSEEEAAQYAEVLKKGGHLICVHIEDPIMAHKAIDILTAHNAKDISLQKYNIEKSNWKDEKFNQSSPH